MILGKKNRFKYSLKIGSITIKESDEVELLGITIDKALNFKKHIKNLCRTAQYKLHALRWIRKYLTLDKAILLGNGFINSQFNYAPLIWMFSHKPTYLKMQKIYHETLRVIYQSGTFYNDLLQLSKSTSLHQQHLYLQMYWYLEPPLPYHTSNIERPHITKSRDWVQYFSFHPQGL